MKLNCRPNLAVDSAYEIDVENVFELVIYTFDLNHIAAYPYNMKHSSRSKFSSRDSAATEP